MRDPAVLHLGCPACGATLARREDQRIVSCRACGNRSVLTGVPCVTRFQAIPRVERSDAVRTVRRCLAGWPVRDGTAERAAILAAELYYVPFLEFEALQAGTLRRDMGSQLVRGGRADRSTGRLRFLDPQGREIPEHEYYRRRTQRVTDTTVILRTHRSAGPAGVGEEWGIAALDLARIREDPDVRIVPYGSPEAPPGQVLAPRRGLAEVEDQVRASAEAIGEARVDFLASDVRYVHLPVWVVRYRVDSHPYAFVVDALHERVLTGRAPEAPRRGALFLVLAAALFGFPLGKTAGAFATGQAQDVGAIVGLAVRFAAETGIFALFLPILLLLPLAYAWGEFRFRGEVVFGPDGPTVVKLARPAVTALERAIEWFSKQVEQAMERSHHR